mgnify:CR=1 FL=1
MEKMTDRTPRKLVIAAADFAVEIDGDVTEIACGKKYALDRATLISLGAFRAFEFLENNGYRVVKVEIDGSNDVG